MIIKGKVIKGDQKGARQGFPTANLNPNLANDISKGVYAAWASLKNKKCPAILIFGAPDKDNKPKLEVFFLENCQNIYGEIIKVEIIKLIRPLINFETKKSFLKQVDKDINQIQNLLKNK